MRSDNGGPTKEEMEEWRARMRPLYFDIFDRLPAKVRDAINYHPIHLPISDAFDLADEDGVQWCDANDVDVGHELLY